MSRTQQRNFRIVICEHCPSGLGKLRSKSKDLDFPESPLGREGRAFDILVLGCLYWRVKDGALLPCVVVVRFQVGKHCHNYSIKKDHSIHKGIVSHNTSLCVLSFIVL